MAEQITLGTLATILILAVAVIINRSLRMSRAARTAIAPKPGSHGFNSIVSTVGVRGIDYLAMFVGGWANDGFWHFRVARWYLSMQGRRRRLRFGFLIAEPDMFWSRVESLVPAMTARIQSLVAASPRLAKKRSRRRAAFTEHVPEIRGGRGQAPESELPEYPEKAPKRCVVAMKAHLAILQC